MDFAKVVNVIIDERAYMPERAITTEEVLADVRKDVDKCILLVGSLRINGSTW